MSFLPVEDHDLSSRTSPPLLSPEIVKKCNKQEINCDRFTKSDLLQCIREENESRMAAIIGMYLINIFYIYLRKIFISIITGVKTFLFDLI